MAHLNDAASLQLKRRIEEIECDIIRVLCEDEGWLSLPLATSLRWALSLSRISKVRMDQERPELDVHIGHESDRYRAELFAILALTLSPLGRIEKGPLARQISSIESLARSHRKDLLAVFSPHLT